MNEKPTLSPPYVLKVPVAECTDRTSPRCSGKCVPTQERPNTCLHCHYANLPR